VAKSRSPLCHRSDADFRARGLLEKLVGGTPGTALTRAAAALRDAPKK
jgi:hypothetical protein